MERNQPMPAPAHARQRLPRRWPDPGGLVRLAAAVLLALSGGLLFTWPRVQTFKVGYAISQQEERRTALIHDQGALLIEVESLRALRRIAQIAREQLAMRPPKPERVVFVEVTRSTASVATPPQASRRPRPHRPPKGAERQGAAWEVLQRVSPQEGGAAAAAAPRQGPGGGGE
ncbi:MAG: cell division protein FtsL [Candidatus Tectomicrobia bacterium]|nr:cell division protein FtsL [Candidatus Tectomicrobia bacterium]